MKHDAHIPHRAPLADSRAEEPRALQHESVEADGADVERRWDESLRESLAAEASRFDVEANLARLLERLPR